MVDKLKHVCPECKTNKWIVDYKEGCFADLTRHSICLFCKQEKEIEKLKKEILELKNKIKETYSLLEDTRKTSKEINDEVVGNGKDIHEIRTQLANRRQIDSERIENKEGKHEEQFLKATGRRVATKKPKPQPKVETATKNRFSLLSEKEEDTILIGDSMVKDQGEYFGLKNQKKKKGQIIPWCYSKEDQRRSRKHENREREDHYHSSGQWK